MVLQGSVKEAASARYEREQPVLLFIETCSTAVEQVTGYAGRVCCGCEDGSLARQRTRGPVRYQDAPRPNEGVPMKARGGRQEAASVRYEREQPVLLFIETCSTAV